MSETIDDTITIRQAEEGDLEKLRAIRLKALQSEPGEFRSSYDKEIAMEEAEWRAWLTSADKAIFLMFENETVVGLAGISVDADDLTCKTAILWGLWLERHMRGRKLSKRFYKPRIDWARLHQTVEQVILSHRESNRMARYANQAFGFEPTHSGERLWPDGGTENALWYRLHVGHELQPG